MHRLLTLTLLVVLPLASIAQESKHSIDLSFGYNFNAPFTYSDNSYELVNIPDDLENTNFTDVVAKLRDGGYGKGFSVAIGYHYNLKENFRLNGGVRYHNMPLENYVWRPEKKFKNLERMELYYNEREVNSIQIEVGIGLKNQLADKWSLNTDVNFVTGFANLHINMMAEEEYNLHQVYKVKTDMKIGYFDGAMFGFNSTLTIEHTLTDHLKIYGGIDFRMINHQQRDADIKNYFYQGDIEVENYGLEVIELSDKSKRGYQLEDSEVPLLYQNRPFSSYGLVLGLNYNI